MQRGLYRAAYISPSRSRFMVQLPQYLTTCGSAYPRLRQIAIAALLAGFLAGCAFSPPPTASSQPVDAPGQSEKPATPPALPPAVTVDPVPTLPGAAPSSIPKNSPSQTPVSAGSQRARYSLVAALDYAQETLEVKEEILYPNQTGESLGNLTLLVEPNHYPGIFTLDSLAGADGAPIDGYSLDGHTLRFPLSQPLGPGESLGLKLSYHLNLQPIPAPSNDSRPVVFGYTERQTNLVDWYPVIPAYRAGTGWLVHDPWFYGEHQVYDCVDFQVDLALTGVPASGLTIAASAPAEQNGDRYVYHHEAARGFALSIGPSYVVSTQTVDGVTVTSYAFPWDEAAGKAALNDTARALALYGQLFGPYPHPSLSVVEADFLDGMEYDGLYFLSRGFYNLYDGTPKGYLTAIAVHETAHQWWFGLVGDDQALEPWLDEAMAAIQELQTRFPDDPYLSDSLAWLHYQRGRYEYAEPLLRRCLEQEPGNALFLYHMGMTEWKRGRAEAARRALRGALERGLESPRWRAAAERVLRGEAGA